MTFPHPRSCENSGKNRTKTEDQVVKFAEKMSGDEFRFTESLSLEKLRELQNQFAAERNWDQYHTPRNLLLALVGEVGELAEIFQWKGEVKEGLPDFTDAEKQHVGQEMSDVLLYLIRLAEKCKIDLPTAVLQKIELNGQKYPANKVYGKSSKYTAYQENENTNGT